MKKVSIAIPCYNEEENIIPAYKKISKVMKTVRSYTYELIFVDNGSTDKSRVLITQLARKDKKVIAIFLSKNFGPEGSGRATLDFASGDAYVGIGCDLQDPPELIPRFIKEWEKGFDIVIATYRRTTENSIMRYIRRIFYFIYNKISNTPIPANAVGYGLWDKKVVNAIKSLPEKYGFTRGLLIWVGFKKTTLSYTRSPRVRGTSSYNIFGYLKDAERGIFGFSYFPLDIIVYSGFILTIFSFIFIVWYLFVVLIFGNPIKASIPLMLAIVFFGGIQLLAISIIGKYIQVIVEETKSRPIYIVEDKINI